METARGLENVGQRLLKKAEPRLSQMVLRLLSRPGTHGLGERLIPLLPTARIWMREHEEVGRIEVVSVIERPDLPPELVVESSGPQAPEVDKYLEI